MKFYYKKAIVSARNKNEAEQFLNIMHQFFGNKLNRAMRAAII